MVLSPALGGALKTKAKLNPPEPPAAVMVCTPVPEIEELPPDVA
jgi:hypothetical protein